MVRLKLSRGCWARLAVMKGSYERSFLFWPERGRRLEEIARQLSGQLGLGTRFRQQDTRAQSRAVNLGRWRP